MIKVVKRVRVTGDSGPFTYQWTSSATVSGCLTFDKASGTTDELIETTLMFASETCKPIITLTVVSACGTKQVFDVSNTLPCVDLVVSEISNNSNVFSVIVGNEKCASHTFEWTYDTKIWEKTALLNNYYSSSLSLLRKKDAPITKSTNLISVKVTDDCYGCSITKKYTYTFNVFAPVNYLVNALEYQDLDFFEYKGNLKFDIPTGMDVTTAKIVLANPSNVTYTNTGFEYEFTTTSNKTVTFDYYIEDGLNNKSLTSTVTLIPILGSASYSILLSNLNFIVPCNQNTYEIDLSSAITTTGTIDWNTFAILGDYQSPSIVFNKDTKKITYTVPANFTSDVFKYTVADIKGNYAKAATISVARCAVPPVANNDSVSLVAGASVTLSILNNDINNGSPFDYNTLTLIDVPTEMIVTDNKNGTITIIAGSLLEGDYTFKYTIKNVEGSESNQATVSVEVINAGSDVSVIICN